MHQAMASTSEPEMPALGPTEAVIIITVGHEPEPRTTVPPKYTHPAESTTEIDVVMNAQEDDTQPVTRGLHVSIMSSTIDQQAPATNKSIADGQNDSHVASASPSD
jgi:hypothetical protein